MEQLLSIAGVVSAFNALILIFAFMSNAPIRNRAQDSAEEASHWREHGDTHA